MVQLNRTQQQHMPNPVIIVATPQSSATQEIRLYPMTRQCMVFWQSPHYSNHSVRRRDMLRLILNLKQSAGAWVNKYALA